MGGDTDTTAAIAGALAGFAQQGQDIPASWLENLWDKPHSVTFLKSLGAGLASAGPCPTSFSPWLAFRNIVFTAIVLTHAFRRLLPPY
jgi:hypothetical protein